MHCWNLPVMKGNRKLRRCSQSTEPIPELFAASLVFREHLPAIRLYFMSHMTKEAKATSGEKVDIS